MAKRPLIETAVFPVAGRGTRFLPATKASPKEMLPVVDKPLIQYAVEEALAAGARRLVFITGASKRAIEDHFDSDQELENLLKSQGKSDLVKQLHSVLPSYATCIYIRQPAPLGLGHAVLCARKLIGDEPFAVILPDDVIAAEKPCLQQMVEAYQETGGAMVATMEVSPAKASSYGVLDIRSQNGPIVSVKGMVEKPPLGTAPSNLAVIGRYILTPQVLANFDQVGRGAGGEIQLTDAIAAEVTAGRDVFGYRFEGQRYDCGSKAGFLQATVAFALARPDLRDEFAAFLTEMHSVKQAAQ